MPAYYNEFDPVAAQWLRNLIAAGHIASGDVDERSIEDVHPSDLEPYEQCHFFAGIGVWSYALRKAGWPDDKPIWTGSCPCQPFSAAGKGDGFADERHLWPSWLYLIDESHPPIILGEQVASSRIGPWIDLVHADLEALDYAFGCVAFPSAGVGAPHIRDRNYWLAYPNDTRLEGWQSVRQRADECAVGPRGMAGGLAHSDGDRRIEGRERCKTVGYGPAIKSDSGFGRLADTYEQQRNGGRNARPGPANGFWRNADWLLCRDGRWRPVEPGTFPLAHGATARVGRLRAYGNAINAQEAKAFVEIVMDWLGYGDL